MIDVPEGGHLLDAHDVEGYISALTDLRDDRSLGEHMGRHNREKALREYEYDVMVRQLCTVYSRVV